MIAEKSKLLIDIIGFDRFCELCKIIGGEQMYIPHNPPHKYRDESIKKEFDVLMYGRNGRVGRLYRVLAKKHGISERQIQRICAKKMTLSHGNVTKQTSII